MRPRLQSLATTQGGVFTRGQALAAGYSETEIRRMTQLGGPWVVVRRSTYCERAVWEGAREYDGHLLLRDRAAHLLMTRPHLMSHDSAARLHDLPFLVPDDPLVHVTRFGVGGSRTREGVKHHLTQLGLLNAVKVDGIKTTGLARTALDLGREHGYECGTVAIDAARRRGVELTELESELSVMWCWPNVTHARAAVADSDPGAETPGESLMRLLLLELALGEIHTQFPVIARGRLRWVDALIGAHAFEFDGRIKFTRSLDDQDPATVAWNEKVRQDALNEEGLGVSRCIWTDLLGRARLATGRRFASDFARSVRVFGSEVPPKLRAFAESEEGRRLRAKRLRDMRDDM